MPTDSIVALLIAERDKLDRAIKALHGPEQSLVTAMNTPAVETSKPSKKRHVSAGARRRMALGQKKRWAALKAAKN
jgi:hypothetical protein